MRKFLFGVDDPSAGPGAVSLFIKALLLTFVVVAGVIAEIWAALFLLLLVMFFVYQGIRSVRVDNF